MKKISTKIFLIFIAINFHHCTKSNDDKALAKYTGGQLTKSELIARIGNNRFNKIIASDSYLKTINGFVYKKIVFDYHEDLFDNQNIVNDIHRISNDQKLKHVMDYLVNNYELNDSIIDFISSSELAKYTIQDIVVTHRLSYSQHQDRSKKEAYAIANKILERIKSKNITFDEAVSIYVEHPSIKIKNGVIGPYPYGKLPKEFSDVIWKSNPGDIIGPIGTKFGYHVFKTIKKENLDAPQTINRKKEIKKEIKGGRYGFLDQHTDAFAEQWFKKFGGEIYIDNIDTLWQIADSIGLFEVPNGISILRLNETGYVKPLAKINNQMLDIDWFIKTSREHGTFKKSSFVKGYFLYNSIKDLLHRYCSIMWFDENKKLFNHHKTLNSIRNMQENHLLKQYINQEIDKDSTLTDNIILNRLAIKYNLEIH